MPESASSEPHPRVAEATAKPASLRLPTRASAVKISLVYATVGVAWIVGSGWLLHHFVRDQSLEAGIEMAKGWVYVAVTALLFGYALDRYFRAIRESAQRLQESEERYRALFDQTVEGVMLMRTDGTDLRVNAAFARMHGYDSPKEMESLGLQDLDTPVSAPLGAERVRRVANGEILTFEVEHYRKDRSTFPLNVTASRVELGGKSYLLTFHRDITERKRAEAEARRQDAHLRLALEAAEMVTWELDILTHRLTYSSNLPNMAGSEEVSAYLSLEDFIQQVHPDDRGQTERAIGQTIQTGALFACEYRVHLPDGSWHWLAGKGRPVIGSDGRATHVVGVSQDITKRKQAEEIARQSQERLSFALQASHTGAWSLNLLDRTATRTLIQAQILGYQAVEGDWSLEKFLAHVVPEDREKVRGLIQNGIASGTDWDFECRIRRVDGEIRWIFVAGGFERETARPLTRVSGIMQDITERKQAALALQESETRLRALVETTFDWVWEVDAEGRYTYASPKAKDILGFSPAEVLGRTPFDFMPKAEAERLAAIFLEIAAKREPFSALENVNCHKDGRLVVLESSGIPMFTPGGQFQGYRGMDRDVTKRKQSEAVLRESLLFRREAEKIGRIGAWKANPARDFLYWTEGVYEIVEAPLDYKPGLAEGLRFFDAESIPVLRQALQTALQDGTPFVVEVGVTTRTGRHLWSEVRGLGRVEEGEDAYVMGTLQDVTERRRLEDQFRQSQKLEAIGQLAGGVAHDFNNLLTAILMRSDLDKEASDLPPEISEAFQDIKQAAERGASLTRQLLLFSRRQVMQPHEVDLNDLVDNLAKMLRRIVGEDIRLKLDLHTAPLWLRADPGMLDQVVMNLTINARDAMPQGGSLILITDDVNLDVEQVRQYVDATPGYYARLTVTDTGCGIPPEILPRIFEPFFTTKEVGKGTGLGLATVFGIVKQHRGWLNVQSTPGQGTTFRVHLPIIRAPKPETTVAIQPKPTGGSETILLVEDDPAVRSAARTILQRQGYNVLVSDRGPAALSASREHPDKIGLLLTDIVMPEGLSGRELAAQLLRERPGLKIIYMSGYSSELAGGELTLKPGQQFLQKPFLPDQLLAHVRSCLDSCEKGT